MQARSDKRKSLIEINTRTSQILADILRDKPSPTANAFLLRLVLGIQRWAPSTTSNVRPRQHPDLRKRVRRKAAKGRAGGPGISGHSARKFKGHQKKQRAKSASPFSSLGSAGTVRALQGRISLAVKEGEELGDLVSEFYLLTVKQIGKKETEALFESFLKSGKMETFISLPLKPKSQNDPVFANQMYNRSAAPADKLLISREIDSKERIELVDVHYATSREPLKSPYDKRKYGERRAKQGDLEYGTATVSIPPNHERGTLERPNWLQKKLGLENELRHITVRQVKAYQRTAYFWKRLEKQAKESGDTALLFVHGFKTSFDDAAMRAAQLSYDIRFEGVTALYAWPSKSRATTGSYMKARNNIAVSTDGFQNFLLELCAQSAIKRVHVIAHSMGCQIAINAIAGHNGPKKEVRKLGEIILAAPDIDSEEFVTSHKKVVSRVNGSTLYASSHDKAIMVSQLLQDYDRAGWAKPMVLAQGLDSVDATPVKMGNFLGHGYFAESQALRYDIMNVLDGVDPGKGARRVLSKSYREKRVYWKLPMEVRA